jgi:hypothetical protein
MWELIDNEAKGICITLPSRTYLRRSANVVRHGEEEIEDDEVDELCDVQSE